MPYIISEHKHNVKDNNTLQLMARQELMRVINDVSNKLMSVIKYEATENDSKKLQFVLSGYMQLSYRCCRQIQ